MRTLLLMTVFLSAFGAQATENIDLKVGEVIGCGVYIPPTDENMAILLETASGEIILRVDESRVMTDVPVLGPRPDMGKVEDVIESLRKIGICPSQNL